MLQKIALFFLRNGAQILIGAGFIYIITSNRVEFNIGNNDVSPKKTQLVSYEESNTASMPFKIEMPTLNSTLEIAKDQWQQMVLKLKKYFNENGNAYLLGTLHPDQVNDYVLKFQRLAILEQNRSGIPASIIIAHGLLQSQAGMAVFTQQTNNHFKLPCTNDWIGSRDLINGECLRSYEDADVSFQDNTYYLTTGPQQQYTGQLGTNDYRAWAYAIERIDLYANKAYAKQLIDVIEHLELYKLDEVNP